MRNYCLFLGLVLATASMSSGLIACGGGDSGSGAPDSGAPDSGGGADSSAPEDAGTEAATGPQAVAAPVTMYLGQLVSLDGSPSSGPAGFTYAWTVVTTPTGSAIDTAALAGANTAKPTFLPDRPGAYTLRLTITAGAASSSADVQATIVDPPIFYFRTEADADAGYQASLEVVGAGDGDGGTPVSCFSSDATAFDSLVSNTSRAGTDWWEAPAGEPSRIVFVFDTREDGGATTSLFATTSEATCATPPRRLEAFPGESTSVRAIEQPRISPNGSRVAYVRTAEGETRIATIAFDGTTPRVLAPSAALPDGGPAPEAPQASPVALRPIWVDDTTVAWLQVLEEGSWQIVRAPDQADATPELLMSCTGDAPSQFDILPSGEVIVSQTINEDSASFTNILAYPITTVTKACGAPRNISALTSANANGYARDFSLSPDKSHVAYQGRDDASDERELRVARVDGTTPPVAVSAPLIGAQRGARWVGGGAFLTWGVDGAALDSGITGSAIAVVAADGGAVRAAASGNGTYAIGNGFWSCSFAPAVGSGVSLFGVVGILSLGLVRRRR